MQCLSAVHKEPGPILLTTVQVSALVVLEMRFRYVCMCVRNTDGIEKWKKKHRNVTTPHWGLCVRSLSLMHTQVRKCHQAMRKYPWEKMNEHLPLQCLVHVVNGWWGFLSVNMSHEYSSCRGVRPNENHLLFSNVRPGPWSYGGDEGRLDLVLLQGGRVLSFHITPCVH